MANSGIMKVDALRSEELDLTCGAPSGGGGGSGTYKAPAWGSEGSDLTNWTARKTRRNCIIIVRATEHAVHRSSFYSALYIISSA